MFSYNKYWSLNYWKGIQRIVKIIYSYQLWKIQISPLISTQVYNKTKEQGFSTSHVKLCCFSNTILSSFFYYIYPQKVDTFQWDTTVIKSLYLNLPSNHFLLIDLKIGFLLNASFPICKRGRVLFYNAGLHVKYSTKKTIQVI